MKSAALACFAAATALMPCAAIGGSLTIVEVGAPAVNCVFRTNCIIPVTDSSAKVALPFLQAGQPFLQSRTFTGTAGTPGAGKTGYEYRLDLRSAKGGSDCILGMTINFGPITKLPYKNNQNADVFVVTTGGLGTIGLKSATQNGDVITFDFSKPMCVGGVATNTLTTFFFGLAAATAPQNTTATLYAIGMPAFYQLAARAPSH